MSKNNQKDASQESLTYAQAGVDITAGNRAVDLMKSAVKSTFRREVLTDIGGFGGLFALDIKKYAEPVLVSGTDGVGTKLRVAMMMDRHDTIGIDCVAMCVNDILVQGAEPLFFLDYLAVGKLDPEKVASIVGGVAEGCRQAGCALIGGETAEMPGFYADEDYDIAGFTVGVADRAKIVDGSTIAPGDLLIALPSSGIHSNGYSLARKVFFEHAGHNIHTELPQLGKTVGEELLVPTRIYANVVKALLTGANVKGMAHITGGGITENLPRILPEGMRASVELGRWDVPPIFSVIKSLGNVAEAEMLRTFNCGIGYVIVVSPEEVGKVSAILSDLNEKFYTIGVIESIPEDGDKTPEVCYRGELPWA
ncbi:phosphoribosylformylglycinamidine cyclo-ligase [Heliorestis acidaminivorans]|uniref:Phosphoribosylformylglycinamidine cyclo-ligase n=1 Tax=Heliorestis acidaminivorans TaxID=553427 RepID=A0A6I0F079_9FIRM|nr:phosphoribosylformylglycinamidine cyclo-ligase [Heliorestis acidaminivorans]KAB2953256.1 phosphoribosylformylglycinamidine cyclo-ligase [Heliorestis acidaminivorans]